MFTMTFTGRRRSSQTARPARPHRRSAVLALLGLAAVTALPTMAQAIELRLLSSFNATQRPTYAVSEQYLANVKKIGGDTVTVKISGPEVVPIFQQLQPASSGVFDMLYTHPVFHAGEGGLALVVDAMKVDPLKRRESGVWDYVDKYYQKRHGLKMVAMMSVSTQGYHLFTKQPLTEAGDLKGRKIRGTPTYFGVIKALGAEPVVLPGSQIYSALQKGIVDGAGWPAAGMVSMKHYEVAAYRLLPNFGVATQPVFVNLKKWNSLSDKEKSVLLKAGELTELEMPWIGDEIQEAEDKQLDKLGVKVAIMPSAIAAKVKAAFVENIWALGKQYCGDAAVELHALADKAGLS